MLSELILASWINKKTEIKLYGYCVFIAMWSFQGKQ